MSRSAVAQKRSIAKRFNEELATKLANLLFEYRSKGYKKANEYKYIRDLLVQEGYKPFDIMAHYQYVGGAPEIKDNWEAAVKMASYIAQRKRGR